MCFNQNKILNKQKIKPFFNPTKLDGAYLQAISTRRCFVFQKQNQKHIQRVFQSNKTRWSLSHIDFNLSLYSDGSTLVYIYIYIYQGCTGPVRFPPKSDSQNPVRSGSHRRNGSRNLDPARLLSKTDPDRSGSQNYEQGLDSVRSESRSSRS